MSQAAGLASRILVNHREPGFLRLELPAELCGTNASAALEQGLMAKAGIFSAAVDRDWQRISIRFTAETLSAGQVARQLFSLLDGLSLSAETPVAEGTAKADIKTAANFPMPSLTAAVSGLQPQLDKLKAMLMPANEPPVDSLQAKLQPVLASALTEKAIMNFLNDLVAFYLVKAHWELITKRWIKTPLAYSNAWMTIFYLVFLLVRYRKTSAAK